MRTAMFGRYQERLRSNGTPHTDARVSAVLCKGHHARAGGRGVWRAQDRRCSLCI
jgi:hypothetical protein